MVSFGSRMECVILIHAFLLRIAERGTVANCPLASRSKGPYRNDGFPTLFACPVTAPRWFVDVNFDCSLI